MMTAFLTAGGHVQKSQSALELVSKLEPYACLGGAQVGIESMIGSAPPLTVLFGHLQGQIVLTEPLWIACFLTAGNAAGKISMVQIASPFWGLGEFHHDIGGIVMILAQSSR